jgi:hypothetical protein
MTIKIMHGFILIPGLSKQFSLRDAHCLKEIT